MPAPPPSGRHIQVGDGDTIVVDGDARVSVVRRRQAEVRVVVLPDSRAMLGHRRLAVTRAAQDMGIERIWRFAGSTANGRSSLAGRAASRSSSPMARGGAAPPLALETPAGRVEFHGARPGSGDHTGRSDGHHLHRHVRRRSAGGVVRRGRAAGAVGQLPAVVLVVVGVVGAGSGASMTLSTAVAVMSRPGCHAAAHAGAAADSRANSRAARSGNHPAGGSAVADQARLPASRAWWSWSSRSPSTARCVTPGWPRSIPMLDEAALAAARQWR